MTINAIGQIILNGPYVADIVTIIFRSIFDQISWSYRSTSTVDGTPGLLCLGFCSPSRLCRSWKWSSRQALPRLHPLSPDRTPRLKGIDGRGHLYTQQGGGSGSFLHRLMCAVMLSTSANHSWVDGAFTSGRRTTISTEHVSLSCSLACASPRRPPSPAAIPGIPGAAEDFLRRTRWTDDRL